MSAAAAAVGRGRRRRLVWSGVLAVWGSLTGVAPHVIHHVGPLAGAALLAGAGGRLLFFALGILVAIPLLLRLHRRFRTWLAPAAALAVFAATFAVSTLLLAPLVTGSDGAAKERPGLQAPSGHAAHHGK